MPVRILSDGDYNKLCTWAENSKFPLLFGESYSGIIHSMRRDNVHCFCIESGDMSLADASVWTYSIDRFYDDVSILGIIREYSKNVPYECEGIRIARRICESFIARDGGVIIEDPGRASGVTIQ